MKSLLLSSIFLTTLGAFGLQAQFYIWDANLTTAVPQFQMGPPVVKTLTFDGGPNGKGIQPRSDAEGNGYSYAYVPVTAPLNTVFSCIGLRAQDSSAANSVTAEFFRQPRAAAGPAQSLGAVTTNNSGFQYVQNALPAAVPIIYPLFTYYVRIKFYRADPGSILRGFDVSLLTACGGGA